MSRLPSRRIGAALLVAVPALAGCGAGLTTGTGSEVSRVVGQAAYVGDVDARNVYVTPSDEHGGTSYIVGTFVNSAQKPDRLVAAKVTSVDGASTQVTISASPSATPLPLASAPGSARPSPVSTGAPGTVPVTGASIVLPPDVPVIFKTPDEGPGPVLEVIGLASPLMEGRQVTITLTFQNAGDVKLLTSVSPADGTSAVQTPIPHESGTIPPSPSHTPGEVPLPFSESPMPTAVPTTPSP